MILNSTRLNLHSSGIVFVRYQIGLLRGSGLPAFIVDLNQLFITYPKNYLEDTDHYD